MSKIQSFIIIESNLVPLIRANTVPADLDPRTKKIAYFVLDKLIVKDRRG